MRRSPLTLGLKIQKLLVDGYRVEFRSDGLDPTMEPYSIYKIGCQISKHGLGWFGTGAVASDAFSEAYSKIYS